MISRKTTRNKLVKKWDERVSYDKYSNALGKKQRGKGIYILYKGKKPYYVGLSTSSLRGRIRRHATKDRHKGKWDNFSFYQILKTKYIKDIESLLLRYYKPDGNKVKGKFHKKYKIKKLKT